MRTAVLAVFWIGTGIVALVSLLQAAEQLGLAGLGPHASRLAIEVTAVIDIALGLLVCIRRIAPLALWGTVLMSPVYIAAGTLWRRDLWLDPWVLCSRCRRSPPWRSWRSSC